MVCRILYIRLSATLTGEHRPYYSAKMRRMRRLCTVSAHLGQADRVDCGGRGTQPDAPALRQGPLTGIRVLDMSAVISGPWGASILADQGADVVKIEGPMRPDLTRRLGGSPELGMASMYVTANRGKRSVTIDLHEPRGVELLKVMVAQSDVVIQNFRPGVSTRLGVDYTTLSAANADLIMLTITGFGETGPYAQAPVYDPVIQAMTGVGDAQNGTVFDADGKESLVHNLMFDKVTALNACQAVTAALLARERGHGGQLIELSMFDAAVHFLYPDSYYNKVWETGKPFPEWNRAFSANYDFVVVDGKVAISVPQEVDRVALAAYLATKTRQEAFDYCLEIGIPCGKFNTRDELLADPQIRHNRTIETHQHPTLGAWTTPRPPANFHVTPSKVTGVPAAMGEHTAEVLGDFGIDAKLVAELQADGVIGNVDSPKFRRKRVDT